MEPAREYTPEAAWSLDGFAEIGFGIWLLANGLAMWLPALWFLPAWLLTASMLLMFDSRVLPELKARWSVPRIGHVRRPNRNPTYRVSKSGVVVAAALAAAFGAVLAALMYYAINTSGGALLPLLESAARWTAPLFGVVIGACVAWGASKRRIWRLCVVGTLVVLASVLLPVASGPMGDFSFQIAVLFSLTGGLFVVSGTIAFVVLLRTHPVLPEYSR